MYRYALERELFAVPKKPGAARHETYLEVSYNVLLSRHERKNHSGWSNKRHPEYAQRIHNQRIQTAERKYDRRNAQYFQEVKPHAKPERQIIQDAFPEEEEQGDNKEYGA